jgi:hypothetical protein
MPRSATETASGLTEPKVDMAKLSAAVTRQGAQSPRRIPIGASRLQRQGLDLDSGVVCRKTE